jgi:hypothetical protein
VNRDSDKIVDMTIFTPLCSIGIAALLPLSCLAQISIGAPTTPAKTTTKYLFVAAVKKKAGKCFTEELVANTSGDAAGTPAVIREEFRDRMRQQHGELSDFRVVPASKWAFVFSYKTRPDKCTNTNIGIVTGDNEAEARRAMEARVREWSGTGPDIIRQWPRPEDRR